MIGRPDDRWGETAVAVVVPSEPAHPPSLSDITSAVAGRLAPHKRPRDVVITDALPRNASCKVLKHLL